MLQLKNNIFENIETTPKEHYTFQFDPSAIVPVEKKYIGLMKKRMLGSIIAGLLLIIIGIFSDRAFLGFGVGVLFISVVGHIKGISAYKKLYAKSIYWFQSRSTSRLSKANLNKKVTKKALLLSLWYNF